ncbi:MAG: glycosyltransferase [Thermodesulfovibrionales bacterium]
MAYRILLSTTIENTLPIGRALHDIGYEVFIFDATIRSNIDRFLFRPTNKILWNLRLMDKNKSVGTKSRYCNKNYRTDAVLKAVNEFKPDCVIFEIGFKPSYEGLVKLRKSVSKVAGWWTMTTRWINIEEREAKLYNAFFFFSEEFVHIARDKGFNAYYLPHAVNDYVFKEVKLTQTEINSLSCDLVFVGAWQRPRQKVISALASQNIGMRIYGPKWMKRCLFNSSILKSIKGSWLFGEELIKQYKAAKIVLNINSWFLESWHGLNQRIFDVPACGAFLLTDYVKEIETFFKPGIEIETYATIEELIDKIHFYLKHDNVRERIARKGYERAQKLPTWRDRAREIVKVLKLPSA